MPRYYKKGGESRLSLEGLTGVTFHGKVIASIWAHAEKRRSRTVKYTDGTSEVVSIKKLLDALINSRGGEDG